jgi:hypothetical protein
MFRVIGVAFHLLIIRTPQIKVSALLMSFESLQCRHV